ncbi:hypothetical protein BGX26_011914 [Mortierella sp. AD094]|nr:hypothetical protein BGX26_011914 [Mortierella sp. AD094]
MLAQVERDGDEKGNGFQWHSGSDESVDFNYGNIESAFQFSSFYRAGGISQSNRSSTRYSQHHQQQDSVSSMQQFYYTPQYGRDSTEGSLRYYSSDYHVDQQDQQQQQPNYNHQEQRFYEHTNLSTVMEATDHGEEIDMPISMSTIQQPQQDQQQYHHHQRQHEEEQIHPFELRNQSQNQIQIQNHRMPIIHKAIAKLTITPSPSSPAATLNCTRRNSLSPSTTLKLKVLDNMATAMMMSERRLPDQNLYDISIDMTDNNNNINNNNNNNNGLGSDDAFAPPSPESCMSQSTTSATLVAMTTASNTTTTDTAKGGDDDVTQESGGYCGNEEDYREPLFSCSLPDWETFKSGLLPTSKHAREALLATIILAFVTIALEAILLQRHRSMTASLTETAGPYEISFFRPLTVYYFIFILAEVFAVGLLWDAIWQHDQLFKGIGVPVDVLNELGDSNTRMILFSQLGVQVTACTGITLLTWRLYSEFGWLVFQKLGADVSLRKMMKEYRLLFTLLKLDAFFFFGYAIQVAALTDKHWQKGLTEVAFAIPLSAVITLLGFCAMRNENKVTMGGFITCLALLIGYMTYRIVALYQTLTGERSTDPYFFSRKTMTVFAALTLFITILALINAVVMLYNFDKGLKEAMRQYRVRRSGTIRSVTPSLHRISVNGGGSICNGGGELSGPGTPRSRPASGGAARNPKRSSKRSLLHCDMSASTLVMTERWQIE